MIDRVIRIGTRGDALAMVQARLVAAGLADHGRRSEIAVVQTAGDQGAQDTAWDERACTSAIEHRLIAGDIDVAVHCAKDVPTEETEGLCIAGG